MKESGLNHVEDAEIDNKYKLLLLSYKTRNRTSTLSSFCQFQLGLSPTSEYFVNIYKPFSVCTRLHYEVMIILIRRKSYLDNCDNGGKIRIRRSWHVNK